MRKIQKIILAAAQAQVLVCMLTIIHPHRIMEVSAVVAQVMRHHNI